MDKAKEVTVIGAGPAGIAAAIYLKRAGHDPLLLDKKGPGGLIVNANLIENYPGFPGGIDGPSLRNRFVEQMQSLGVSVTRAHVKRISRVHKIFRVETDNGDYDSLVIIVATGTRPKRIRMKGAKALEGKKVFYDLEGVLANNIVDGRIIVVGGGDIAFDYAINLRERGWKVKIVSRSTPRCLPLLWKRAEEKGIDVLVGYSPVEVLDKDDSLVLLCNSHGESKEVEGDRLLIACGRVPNLEVLDSRLRRNLWRRGLPETGVPGLYLVGDVARKRYRQAGIAVGDGILAAMMADSYLKKGGRR
ncbi:MAG: NAD(P)/FAD-dependent oxidoreductase [Methanomassiliicoccales archaeon]|nr:NAD(P)/FAD-dependent oxidoreductase [Methanomassiliicoccales archaeon]